MTDTKERAEAVIKLVNLGQAMAVVKTIQNCISQLPQEVWVGDGYTQMLKHCEATISVLEVQLGRVAERLITEK